MKLKRYIGGILILLMLMIPVESYAGIAGPEAFENLTWELVHEEELHGGIVQSVCVTDKYIICIENMADDSSVYDYVSAYYRYDTDAEGNPVEQYSLANRVCEREWEHGNGMTYNPKTNEIYVSLYTNTIEENRGSLYVMDPDTLEYKRTIKISDDYNILGIDYIENLDQYIIQTNVDGGYSYKILDSDFQIIDDFGAFQGDTVGYNFQDCVVSENYIITFPLTLNTGMGDYLSIYSVDERTLLTEVPLDFGIEDDISDEPESICEIGPGEYLAAVTLYSGDNNVLRMYKTTIPYYYEINVESENGQVSSHSIQVLRGENSTVSFTPDEGYEFASLTLDGVEQEIEEGAESFELTNVQANHTIKVTFSEIPFPIFRTVLIALGTLAAIIFVLFIFRRIEFELKRKRRRKARAKRRSRNRQREAMIEKELEQLEELEEIIDKQL